MRELFRNELPCDHRRPAAIGNVSGCWASVMMASGEGDDDIDGDSDPGRKGKVWLLHCEFVEEY